MALPMQLAGGSVSVLRKSRSVAVIIPRMKTQIITLAAHDDLISVRDRMSWAKAPRILLVWPAYEQVPLRPLDLRVLQQHAATLGAQLGLVTRRGAVRRDAEAFGIPVFRTTVDAQRGSWTAGRPRFRRFRRRRGRTLAALQGLRQSAHSHQHGWADRPVLRVVVFGFAVLAVLSLASLFVPRATVILKPITQEQSSAISLQLREGVGEGLLTGGVKTDVMTVPVSGSQTMGVQTQANIPTTKAQGTVRFANLTRTPLVIPAGTIVFSLAPSSMRFATQTEVQLAGDTSSVVDARVEALEPGPEGNLPANAIQGVEGSLSAASTVVNPSPTTGGTDAAETVPSQEDREKLRTILLSELAKEAEAKLKAQGADELVILPGTISPISVDEEIFDPQPGKPGSVLKLSLTVTFKASAAKWNDLRRLAEVTLDASAPPDFVEKPGTLDFQLSPGESDEGTSISRFELAARRSIMHRIDPGTASELARGGTRRRATAALEAILPLEESPEIILSPGWWPWMPLIPFRIQVTVT